MACSAKVPRPAFGGGRQPSAPMTRPLVPSDRHQPTSLKPLLRPGHGRRASASTADPRTDRERPGRQRGQRGAEDGDAGDRSGGHDPASNSSPASCSSGWPMSVMGAVSPFVGSALLLPHWLGRASVIPDVERRARARCYDERESGRDVPRRRRRRSRGSPPTTASLTVRATYASALAGPRVLGRHDRQLARLLLPLAGQMIGG